jgi:dihydrofolate reductase
MGRQPVNSCTSCPSTTSSATKLPTSGARFTPECITARCNPGTSTFDIFRAYWPDPTDPANPIATAINSQPKYVVSNSLSEADAKWRGEHPDTAGLVTGDVVTAVQDLKDESGDELQMWGSGTLLQTLLQHELVDRFRLMTFPLVLGTGHRLFNEGIHAATMRAVDLTMTDLGVVIGTYEPAGPVRHGRM